MKNMTDREWAELVENNKDAIQSYCEQALGASLFSRTYWTVEMDRWGNISLNEYLDDRAVSMEVFEGSAIVVAKFAPYTPTYDFADGEILELIEEACGAPDIFEKFLKTCEEHDVPGCLNRVTH